MRKVESEVMKLRTVLLALGSLMICMALLICYCACIEASRADRELEEMFEYHSGDKENSS